jgi:hypothetical protein
VESIVRTYLKPRLADDSRLTHASLCRKGGRASHYYIHGVFLNLSLVPFTGPSPINSAAMLKPGSMPTPSPCS